MPHCEVCDDLGVVTKNVAVGHPDFGKTFPCPNCQVYEKRRLDNIIRMSRLDAHTDQTFGNFLTEIDHYNEEENRALRNSLATAQRYADEAKGWLLLYGNCGTGKTHLAAAIANELVQKGMRTIFVTVPDLLDYLRSTYAPSSGITYDQEFDLLSSVQILVMDDLGAENPTPWAQEKLYQLINARHTRRLPTIITTNIVPAIFEERIASRILDKMLVTQVRLEAPDFRATSGDLTHPELQNISPLAAYRDLLLDTLVPSIPGLFDYKNAIEFMYQFADKPDGWVIVLGGHGSGKTHLAAGVVNLWRMQTEREDALILHTADLLDYLRASFSNSASIDLNKRMQIIRDAALLVLDDFSLATSSKASNWAIDKLFQILDYRYLTRKGTIFTMLNSAYQVIREEYPAIHSRMQDSNLSHSILLKGPDMRQQRAILNQILKAR